MNYKRMVYPSVYDDEDLIQDVWNEYLQKNSLVFSTKEELYERAKHDAGLLVTMYKRKQQNGFREQKKLSPLTDDIYSIEDEIEDRLDYEERLRGLDKRQLDAVQYFIGLYNLDRPLHPQERTKLKRLRQSTGLPLVLDRKKLKG